MKQEIIPACNEYLVKIYNPDPTAPTSYKCMTSAERDSYMNAVYQQRHSENGVFFVLGVLFVVSLIILAAYWIDVRQEKKRFK